MADERRRRLSPNAAATVVLALVAGAILLWQQPWSSPEAATAPVMIPADVSAQLTRQFRAMSAAVDQDAFTEAFGTGPRARGFARTTWTSLQALQATDVNVRYISGGETFDSMEGTSSAVAEVSWQPGPASGLRPTLHRASVSFRILPNKDGSVDVVAAAPRTGIMPLWLIGALAVEHDDERVVVSIDGGVSAQPISRMAAHARTTVLQTLPTTTGRVVVVVPRTAAQLAQAVGRGGADQIAAVTTHLDVPSPSARDAVIVVNPTVFAAMDQRAAQIVLSHEAVHQMTRAVGTRGETWAVEGFADFVALRDDKQPLNVSAGQILAEVKQGRLPAALPDAAAFSESGAGLGATYESAWMAFRMLAEQHGTADVIAFYQVVLAGTPVATALRDVFGLTEEQVTAQWRAYLTKSASTVS